MMSDELLPAINVLEKKLEEQLRGAADTKKLINMLLVTMGKAPKYLEESISSSIIRPDQFYGRQLATVIAEFLEMRKQACQVPEILQGLRDGGFDFEAAGWKAGDEFRMLALSIAKNTVKFHRLKNGSIGLKSWYDEDFLKRVAKQKSDVIATAAEQVSSKDENAEPTANGSGDLNQKETTG